MEEKLPVTQIITQSAYELKVESRIQAAVKGAKTITEQLASKGIKLAVPNEALFKSWIETFIIDGTETIKNVDNVKMKLSFSWSHDRQV